MCNHGHGRTKTGGCWRRCVGAEQAANRRDQFLVLGSAPHLHVLEETRPLGGERGAGWPVVVWCRVWPSCYSADAGNGVQVVRHWRSQSLHDTRQGRHLQDPFRIREVLDPRGSGKKATLQRTSFSVRHRWLDCSLTRLSFSRLFLVFFLYFSCSQVRARNYDSAQLSRADSLKAVARLCSLLIEVSDALVMWTDYYT